MGQITFSIDPKLESDFRKKAGILYGARKNSVGIALRYAISEFLVNSDTSENDKEEVQQ